MAHDLCVVRLRDACLDYMAVHVNHPQEVQAHWRSETTERGAAEDQRVLVGLVMRSQIVQIQELDLEHGGEGAVAQVAQHKHREHFYGQEIVVLLGRIYHQRKHGQDGRSTKERHFGPYNNNT